MKLLGVYQLNNGEIFFVGNDKKQKCIKWLNKKEQFTWRGKELTCCGVHNDIIFCFAVDGYLYKIYDHKIDVIQHEYENALFHCCVGFGDNKIIAGGYKGDMIIYNIVSNQFQFFNIMDFGVGEALNIMCIVEHFKGVALLGAKELIAFLDNDLNFVNHQPANPRWAQYRRGVYLNESIWVFAQEGVSSFIAEFNSGGIRYHPSPYNHLLRTPVFSMHNNKLMIANDKIYIGYPDSWLQVADFGAPEIIGIFYDKNKGNYKSISYKESIMEFSL